MKYLLLFALILASTAAHAQKIDVEARGNQVLIIERTTTPDGNPVEVATWRVSPQKYLADQLEETGRKVAILPATAPRVGRRPYIRRGRAIIAQRPPTHNYLKQPGYPMPGWQV